MIFEGTQLNHRHIHTASASLNLFVLVSVLKFELISGEYDGPTVGFHKHKSPSPQSSLSLSLLWLSLCHGSSLRLLYSLRIIWTKLNWTQLGGIIRHSAGRPDTWRVIKGLVLPFDAKWKKMASLSPADCCLASFTWISRPSRHCAADCKCVGNCTASEWRLP